MGRAFSSEKPIGEERLFSFRKGDAGVAHVVNRDLLWGVLLILGGVLVIDAYLLWVDMYRPDFPVPWGGIGFVLIFLGAILLIAGILRGRGATQRKQSELRKRP